MAEKLQKALESYKVPKLLRQPGKYPNGRLVPIFRDRSDLRASNDLGAVIRGALEDSEYLIVLCSPAAAASRWVNAEVSYFKELGRANKIIAVVVSGLPAANNPREMPMGAFPGSLFEVGGVEGTLAEPLAADMRERATDGRGGDGFHLAKLKIVAAMLGVSLGELTQRQAETTRRNRLIAGALVCSLALAAGGGVVAWNQSLQKTEVRVGTAITEATLQIGDTVDLIERYALPPEAIRERLTASGEKLKGMLTDTSLSPILVLQRARVNLELAKLYDKAGDEQSLRKRDALIEASAVDLNWLEHRSPSVLEQITRFSAPDPAAIAAVRLNLYERRAEYASFAGRFSEATGSTGARIALAQKWLSESGHLRWARELAQGHCQLGLIQYLSGKLTAAEAEYRRCAQLTLSLIESSQSTSDRYDLIAALSSLSTTLLELDQRREALELMEGVRRQMASLASEGIGDVEFRRLQLVSLSRMGDMMMAVEMDTAKALETYQEALTISNSLKKSDDRRVDWQRDRSILLERLSSAHLNLAISGSFETVRQAEIYVQEAMQIMTRLLSINPFNQEYLRDQSVLRERRGQIDFAVYKQSGNTQRLEDSARSYAELISDRRQILKADPSSLLAKVDLSAALVQFGEVAMESSAHIDSAEGAFKEALQLLEDLTESKSAPAPWMREVAKTHVALGNLYQRKGRIPDARAEIHVALDIIRNLRQLNPNVRQYEQDEAYLIDRQSDLGKQ